LYIIIVILRPDEYNKDMSLALYRKYRPQKFADLVGHDDLRAVIQSAARQDKFSHAYLFYGSRGTGKTTVARIIAKAANCETRRNDLNFREQGEPCNNCRVCSEIDKGVALDVVEIDAASNRGIDEIRELKEGIKLSPASYTRKVYIIDEMHMLTREAANALLKTLEEPPVHAILILATTEYDKIPATILSRAQRFHFKRLPLYEIVFKLNRIVAAENIKISPDAIEFLASMAEGSLRDAESLLQQVSSISENISGDEVSKLLGRVGAKSVAEFCDFLIRRDTGGALNYLNAFASDGHNVLDLTKETINYLRRVLALRYDSRIETLFARELTQDVLKKLKAHGSAIEPVTATALLKSLIRAYGEMRYSPLVVAPLEVAIFENLPGKLI
jgi:DNA polymerase-3 subunit gamma/tau